MLVPFQLRASSRRSVMTAGVVIILLVVVGSVLCSERPCRRPRKGAAVIPLIDTPVLTSQIANTKVAVTAVASLAVVTAGGVLAAVFATAAVRAF